MPDHRAMVLRSFRRRAQSPSGPTLFLTLFPSPPRYLSGSPLDAGAPFSFSSGGAFISFLFPNNPCPEMAIVDPPPHLSPYRSKTRIGGNPSFLLLLTRRRGLCIIFLVPPTGTTDLLPVSRFSQAPARRFQEFFHPFSAAEGPPIPCPLKKGRRASPGQRRRALVFLQEGVLTHDILFSLTSVIGCCLRPARLRLFFSKLMLLPPFARSASIFLRDSEWTCPT